MFLVNEYQSGQGIMAHQDGPLYHPCVAIVSLGSTCVMNFYPHPRLQESSKEDVESQSKQKQPAEEINYNESVDQSDDQREVSTKKLAMSVFLRPRSLILFKDSLYLDYLHEIQNIQVDKITDMVVNCEAAGVQVGSEIIREGTRVSLTIRTVNKVLKGLLKLSK